MDEIDRSTAMEKGMESAVEIVEDIQQGIENTVVMEEALDGGVIEASDDVYDSNLVFFKGELPENVLEGGVLSQDIFTPHLTTNVICNISKSVKDKSLNNDFGLLNNDSINVEPSPNNKSQPVDSTPTGNMIEILPVIHDSKIAKSPKHDDNVSQNQQQTIIVDEGDRNEICNETEVKEEEYTEISDVPSIISHSPEIAKSPKHDDNVTQHQEQTIMVDEGDRYKSCNETEVKVEEYTEISDVPSIISHNVEIAKSPKHDDNVSQNQQQTIMGDEGDRNEIWNETELKVEDYIEISDVPSIISHSPEIAKSPKHDDNVTQHQEQTIMVDEGERYKSCNETEVKVEEYTEISDVPSIISHNVEIAKSPKHDDNVSQNQQQTIMGDEGDRNEIWNETELKVEDYIEISDVPSIISHSPEIAKSPKHDDNVTQHQEQTIMVDEGDRYKSCNETEVKVEEYTEISDVPSIISHNVEIAKSPKHDDNVSQNQQQTIMGDEGDRNEIWNETELKVEDYIEISDVPSIISHSPEIAKSPKHDDNVTQHQEQTIMVDEGDRYKSCNETEVKVEEYTEISDVPSIISHNVEIAKSPKHDDNVSQNQQQTIMGDEGDRNEIWNETELKVEDYIEISDVPSIISHNLETAKSPKHDDNGTQNQQRTINTDEVDKYKSCNETEVKVEEYTEISDVPSIISHNVEIAKSPKNDDNVSQNQQQTIMGDEGDRNEIWNETELKVEDYIEISDVPSIISHNLETAKSPKHDDNVTQNQQRTINADEVDRYKSCNETEVKVEEYTEISDVPSIISHNVEIAKSPKNDDNVSQNQQQTIMGDEGDRNEIWNETELKVEDYIEISDVPSIISHSPEIAKSPKHDDNVTQNQRQTIMVVEGDRNEIWNETELKVEDYIEISDVPSIISHNTEIAKSPKHDDTISQNQQQTIMVDEGDGNEIWNETELKLEDYIEISDVPSIISHNPEIAKSPKHYDTISQNQQQTIMVDEGDRNESWNETELKLEDYIEISDAPSIISHNLETAKSPKHDDNVTQNQQRTINADEVDRYKSCNETEVKVEEYTEISDVPSIISHNVEIAKSKHDDNVSQNQQQTIMVDEGDRNEIWNETELKVEDYIEISDVPSMDDCKSFNTNITNKTNTESNTNIESHSIIKRSEGVFENMYFCDVASTSKDSFPQRKTAGEFYGKFSSKNESVSACSSKSISCDICNYKCSIKASMVSHMRIHTVEKSFWCDLCNFKCTAKSDLIRHIRTHTDEKPFCCDLCNFKCTAKSNLIRHIRTHTDEKPFYCDLCNFKCTAKSDLIRHIRTHEEEKPFCCDLCNFKCTAKSGLIRHIRTHTDEKPFCCDLCYFKCTANSDLNRHIRTHEEEKPFCCDLCNFKCTAKSDLIRHIRTHEEEKPFSCKICKYKCSEMNRLLRHTKTHTRQKPLSCKLCDYKCSQMISLKRHIMFHTGKKPYSCKLCNYKSNLREHLVRHMKAHPGKPFACDICNFECTTKPTFICHIKSHCDEQTFSCDICNYKSRLKASLIRHVKNHYRDKPFWCDYCSYKCGERTEIIRHISTHSGYKPLSCEYCNYKCFNKDLLLDHIRSHTGEKPFSCKLCDSTFGNIMYLERHMRIHTDETFTCEYCSYSSRDKENLTTHLRTHSGEKPFSCDICEYKCDYKSSIIRHMKVHATQKPKKPTQMSNLLTHTDAKSYSCTICNYECRQQSTLANHMKTHSDQQTYICQHCDYKTNQKDHFYKHLPIHSVEKYSCSQCSYKCSQKASLRKHINVHIREKSFSCHVCGYKCHHVTVFFRHMSTHTGVKPYSCDQCEFRCRIKSSLARHMQLHIGEKPFSCHLCDYKSRQKSNLVYHINTHTGEKRYACKFCDFKCGRKKSMSSHMEMLHSCETVESDSS